MSALHIIFYLFAAISIISALMVVVSKNSVHGVLFLVLTFSGMGGIWISLHAEFLALILVLVYVGAVMTLFLFVVMMLRVQTEMHQRGFVKYLPFAALAIALIVGIILMVIGPKHFGVAQMPLPLAQPENYSNTADLGSVLYTIYAYPFEVAGVLLLTAIIATIGLAHRSPKQRKVQITAAQIAVQPKDRVKLVNVPSEKKYKPGKLI